MSNITEKKKYKGATKHCVYGTCSHDSRYKKDIDMYTFIKFPQPCLIYRKGMNKSKKHINSCEKCKKCDKWVRLCNRSDGKFTSLKDVTKDKYICSSHFRDNNPTMENPDPIPAKHDAVKKEKCRNLNLLSQKKSKNYTVEVDNSNMEENVLEQVLRKDGENLKAFEESASVLKKCDKEIQTSFRVVDVDNIKMKLKKQILISKQLLKEKEDLKRIKRQHFVHLFVNSLKENENECYFYTSLNYEQIIILYNFLNPTEEKLKYWYPKFYKNKPKKTVSNIGRKKSFTYLEELILTLVRLRAGLLVEDMSFRFKISKSTLSRIFTTWIQFMYLEFNDIRSAMFPSQHKILEYLPECFKRLKNIRVIIDGAEFFCESSSNFEQQGNLYSSYKHHTTYKVLLGVTPNGAISFVSQLFEGAISDRDLFYKSGLIDLLEEGDMVLADRGFTVADLLGVKKVCLNIPPFLKGRDKFTPQEEIETKNIAKERIYVEHAVGRLKQFRIFNRILPYNMRSLMSQIVFICACITNFRNPIVM